MRSNTVEKRLINKNEGLQLLMILGGID